MKLNNDNLFLDWSDSLEGANVLAFDNVSSLYNSLASLKDMVTHVEKSGIAVSPFKNKNNEYAYALCYVIEPPYVICYDRDNEKLLVLPKELADRNFGRFVIVSNDWTTLKGAVDRLEESACYRDMMIDYAKGKKVEFYSSTEQEWAEVIGKPIWGPRDRYRIKPDDCDISNIKDMFRSLLHMIEHSSLYDNVSNISVCIENKEGDMEVLRISKEDDNA